MKRLVIGGMVLTAVACGGGTEKGGADTAAQGAAPAAGAATAAAGGGSVTGHVKFDGAPPANPAIDLAEEAACKAKYTGPAVDPVVMVENGMLGNVVVYVKSGL